MRIHRGDIVYDDQGRPGVVVDKSETSGELLVEREGPQYEQARRRGFINGLKPSERDSYRAITQELSRIENPRQKLSYLETQIRGLQKDPRNQNLLRYLTSEKAHVIHTTGITPRYYTAAEA